MLIVEKIPVEIYLVALDLMGQERPDDTAAARATYDSAVQRVDYDPPHIDDKTPLTAFGAALAMYVSLSGPFAEEGGEFAGVGGYSV